MRGGSAPEAAFVPARPLVTAYVLLEGGLQPLDELARWAAEGVRGEITVVVAGATAPVADLEGQLDGIRARVAAGERLKAVCAEVAAETGLSRKALYDAVVNSRAPSAP